MFPWNRHSGVLGVDAAAISLSMDGRWPAATPLRLPERFEQSSLPSQPGLGWALVAVQVIRGPEDRSCPSGEVPPMRVRPALLSLHRIEPNSHLRAIHSDPPASANSRAVSLSGVPSSTG